MKTNGLFAEGKGLFEKESNEEKVQQFFKERLKEPKLLPSSEEIAKRLIKIGDSRRRRMDFLEEQIAIHRNYINAWSVHIKEVEEKYKENPLHPYFNDADPKEALERMHDHLRDVENILKTLTDNYEGFFPFPKPNKILSGSSNPEVIEELIATWDNPDEPKIQSEETLDKYIERRFCFDTSKVSKTGDYIIWLGSLEELIIWMALLKENNIILIGSGKIIGSKKRIGLPSFVENHFLLFEDSLKYINIDSYYSTGTKILDNKKKEIPKEKISVGDKSLDIIGLNIKPYYMKFYTPIFNSLKRIMRAKLN